MSATYTLGELALIADGQLIGNAATEITGLAFDSRTITEPAGVLFFAVRGSLGDGHRYINELFKRGTSGFVVDNDYQIPENLHGANFIVVKNSVKALQAIATEHRSRFNIPVVAITGSNGKTIVKEWLGQVLEGNEKVTRSPLSYNSQIGVPLSVWQLNSASTIGIFEAGISQPGEMDWLEAIIKPDIGIITNLGSAHQENFSSLEEKALEKFKLFTSAKVIICCRDHELIYKPLAKLYPEKKIITWGRHQDADLRLTSYSFNGNSTLELCWQDKNFAVKIPFADNISIENVMPVILFLLQRNYEFQKIGEKVALLEPVAMRLEQKEGINGCLVINDSYNSDLTSLEVALDFLNQQALKRGGKRTLVMSDMHQTGLPPETLYPKVATLIKNRGIDRLIGVGPKISSFSACFNEDDSFFPSTEALLRALPSFSFNREAILVKGARSFAFERVTAMLELKQHVTVLELNLNAFVNNLNVFRERLKPGTKVLAMVKAFGYGSGSHEIASVLQHNKVDYLGVAFVDEGMELREAGITLPIIVMNPEANGFGQMLQYNLEPEIYSFGVLEAFNKAVEQSGTGTANIHIEVDTGMIRLGLFKDEVARLIDTLKRMPHVKVQSVFTHLAGSDEEVHDEFTRQQVADFNLFCQQLKQGIGQGFLMHVLNSAGIERFPEAQHDMVRLGIGLFGISPVNETRLKNVVTLKTHVLQVKTLPGNETIGYGRAGKIKPGGQVAVIPIGYADGLDRHLGNRRGEVLVKNCMAPIVGNICMDMCMIDVTGIEVEEGDEVIIFGDKLPFTTLAEKLETIPYEILSRISRRVKRVYFRE